MSEALTDRFSNMVRESVETRRRERGLQHAIHDTSRIYGLTVRRVRACLYKEVRMVEAAEWLSVRSRFLEQLEEEARKHDARAALLRARLDAMRRTAD